VIDCRYLIIKIRTDRAQRFSVSVLIHSINSAQTQRLTMIKLSTNTNKTDLSALAWTFEFGEYATYINNDCQITTEQRLYAITATTFICDVEIRFDFAADVLAPSKSATGNWKLDDVKLVKSSVTLLDQNDIAIRDDLVALYSDEILDQVLVQLTDDDLPKWSETA